MKKHFLIIALLTVVFLGLGNYSYVNATDCNGPNETGSIIPGGGCVCIDGFKRVNGVCKNCNLPEVCCGVELNTDVPFIGKCLEDQAYTGDATVVSQEDAFPVLMGSLTQILVTVILIISFVIIVIGGIMISTAGANSGNAAEGKKLIMKVVIGIAILGASGVILRLINPNFFG